jgi:hypothetical protein
MCLRHAHHRAGQYTTLTDVTPPFGSGDVTVNFRAFFYNTSVIFPGQQACASEGMSLRFKAPV